MAKLLGQEKSGHRLDRYWLHTDDTHRDVITIQTIEDVEPILENNAALRSDLPGKFHKRPDTMFAKKIASIPGTVLEEYCRIKKIKFREFMAMQTDRSQRLWNELLNDPAFCKLRIEPGRVDVARGK